MSAEGISVVHKHSLYAALEPGSFIRAFRAALQSIHIQAVAKMMDLPHLRWVHSSFFYSINK